MNGWEDFVEKLSGEVRLEIQEVNSARTLYGLLVDEVGSIYGRSVGNRPPSVIDEDDAIALFAITRQSRPEQVVEVGVSDGVSTTMILSAMAVNGRGHLTSIDLPLVGIPRLYGKEPGWLVPSQLRARWTLLLGPSSRLLAGDLGLESPIDLFFHDGEHSYSLVTRELNWAGRHARDGTICLVDDALAHSGVNRAAVESGLGADRIYVTRQGLGGYIVRGNSSRGAHSSD